MVISVVIKKQTVIPLKRIYSDIVRLLINLRESFYYVVVFLRNIFINIYLKKTFLSKN